MPNSFSMKCLNSMFVAVGACRFLWLEAWWWNVDDEKLVLLYAWRVFVIPWITFDSFYSIRRFSNSVILVAFFHRRELWWMCCQSKHLYLVEDIARISDMLDFDILHYQSLSSHFHFPSNHYPFVSFGNHSVVCQEPMNV